MLFVIRHRVAYVQNNEICCLLRPRVPIYHNFNVCASVEMLKNVSAAMDAHYLPLKNARAFANDTDAIRFEIRA